MTEYINGVPVGEAPAAHKDTHQDTGGDEIDVVGLSGLLADDQHVLDNEVTAVAVARSILDAQSILIAVSDNDPVALAVAASRIVGRKSTGNIIALTGAELRTIIDFTAQARSAAVSDSAYAAGWNGVATIAPSKNAVYDKIETLGDGGVSFTELLGNEDKKVASINTWEDWDLSAIIGAGAVAVLVAVANTNSTTIRTAFARKNGSAISRGFGPRGGDFYPYSQSIMLFECDVNRIIEIKSNNTTDIIYGIKGYWN